MSNRSRREAASRAEARRRTRQVERGDEAPESAEEPGHEAAPVRQGPAGGLLGRLFPSAPPLPGRPDPLAGFSYQGPFRSVVAALYLLGRHPRAWLPMGLAWAVAQMVALLNQVVANGYFSHYAKPPPTFELLDTIVLVIGAFAILAAGWIGWERPWLFGVAAVIAGSVVQAIALALIFDNALPASIGLPELFVSLTVNKLPQWLFAAFLGWYGGYLRRRTAVTAVPAARRRRR